MKTTVLEPESWKRVVTVEIPEEDVRKAFNEKLKTYRHDMKLPGFRPGKVPENLIKQRFGPSIRAEIIDEFIQNTFRETCKEHTIVPVAAPRVIDVKSNEGEPLVFSIETEVDPVIDITGYRKLKIRPSPKKIKDSDVDAALQNLRERCATFAEVDHPVKKGDYVKLEYVKVVIDGEERKDIVSPAHPVEVGGENGLKDFHKGITGRCAGETVFLTVKFPNNYSGRNVAGKNGEFTVKLLSVQEKTVPEINEAFLKKLGDFADETVLRAKIRDDLEKEERRRAKEEAHHKAIDALIKENEFEVPPARVEQFIEYMYQEALKYKRPEDAAPQRDEVAQRYRDAAVNSIKRQRIIEAVAEKEHIQPVQWEVDAEITRIAETYRQDFETLKQALRKNGTTLRIRDEIRERKTLDYLIGEYTPAEAKE
ncbi:MAG: trigger factor [Chitinispirillaceae bacterium]|nr:trigger factor [Chitinispirillaceae bacterium]